MSLKNEKFSHGDSIGGSYIKWLLRESEVDPFEFKFLSEIANETLFYRKQYAYISADKFSCSIAKRKRMLKELQERDLLVYRRTSAYTMYQLVLPKKLNEKIRWPKGEKLDANQNDNTGNEPPSWIPGK